MAEFFDPSTAPATQPVADPAALMAPPNPYGDEQKLLALFDRLKREAFEYRWVYERDWQRDLYYIAERQWIMYHPTRREWVDKRLKEWMPKVTTNKMAETLQSIRTNLAAINLTVKARPVGDDPQSMAAAEIADLIAPLIHEEHLMNQVMREADFWLIATGNACLQVSWDTDTRFNKLFVPHEMCVTCQQVSKPQDIAATGNMCPHCGSNQFMPATNPDGTPAGEFVAFGKGKTRALSPFEYAFPPNVTRWDELPYLIVMRWRDRHYYEANHQDILHRLVFEKSPEQRSLQLYKALALMNDIGGGSSFASFGASTSATVEGLTEYELWMKPTPEHPQGLVLRVAGDKNPVLIQAPQEGIPGPFPYKDIEGNPLFPFMHSQYEHFGGRLYGRSAISPLIKKQDQLNQLDSLIQLMIMRCANPVIVLPEGAGIDQLTGQPGQVIKWNPLAVGGTGAKPDRWEGENIPSSLMQLREQHIKDIEELSGAYDIIKGQKPTGIEAFSALQLLVERSQSRFTSVFQARGEMYRRWFAIALELERQFGPDQRTWAVIGPNKGYTFEHFENAQLQGQISIQIEDGSNMPKTSLGKRAAIEQANQLALLNTQDPDQRRHLLQTFGLTDLEPALNAHVTMAATIQDNFEKWAQNPVGPPPLVIKPWHDLNIHWTERIKWLNTDRMVTLMAERPEIEQIVTQHLMELQMMMAPPTVVDPVTGAPVPGGGAGGAQAMSSSNSESGSIDTLPKGNNEASTQKQGPR